jgi:hypothetical protein
LDLLVLAKNSSVGYFFVSQLTGCVQKNPTSPIKYLHQYLADEDVSSNHPLPMYVRMLAV